MPAIAYQVLKLSGYAPAVPTPFDDAGKIDPTAFERFCDRQVKEGASALVVCGTTGEASTLSRSEHVELVRAAVRVAGGRVPVIAGAGSNSTDHAIELTRDAEGAGADAILSVVPYYNKPPQDGLYAHFRAIAECTGLPIILYDVPSRTVCSLSDDTVVRLAELPQIIGLKDATGDVSRPLRLRPRVGPRFRLLSGDDATVLGFLAHGGNGCISVTSNLAPGLCRDLYLACKQGHMARMQRLAKPVAQLTSALLRESNPGPLKHALGLLGLMSSRVRLPLVEPAEQTKREIESILSQVYCGFSGYVVGWPRGLLDRAALAS